MKEHVTLERLGDYADGALDPTDAHHVEAHVNACTQCADDLSRLRRLLGAAAALPRVIDPPDELWTSVREALEVRKVARLRSRPLSANAWSSATLGWAAASLILVIASSAFVVRIGHAPRSGGNSPVAPASANAVATAAATPASVAAIERNYRPTVDQLAASLRDRSNATPSTAVAAVDRSLRVVDSAIAETRAALVQDPNNRGVADLLAANYQRKVDLLKRASELAAGL